MLKAYYKYLINVLLIIFDFLYLKFSIFPDKKIISCKKITSEKTRY